MREKQFSGQICSAGESIDHILKTEIENCLPFWEMMFQVLFIEVALQMFWQCLSNISLQIFSFSFVLFFVKENKILWYAKSQCCYQCYCFLCHWCQSHCVNLLCHNFKTTELQRLAAVLLFQAFQLYFMNFSNKKSSAESLDVGRRQGNLGPNGEDVYEPVCGKLGHRLYL